MKCSKCQNDTFKIEVFDSCDSCEFNGAYDGEGEEYTYDHHKIKHEELERDEVEDKSNCAYDNGAYGAGCHMYTCVKCKHTDNSPTIEN